MDAKNDEFDEVEHFSDLAKIRYEIATVMRNHQLIDEIKPFDGHVNPFHGKIAKDPNAMFVVEFIDDIIPYCIYTHYGSFELFANNDSYLQLTAQFLSQEQKDCFINDLRKKLHMVVIKPCVKDYVNSTILQPAVYGITKLSWKDKAFTAMYQKSFSLKPVNVESTESKHLLAVLAKVNNNFKKIGHPELCYSYSSEIQSTTIALPDREK